MDFILILWFATVITHLAPIRLGKKKTEKPEIDACSAQINYLMSMPCHAILHN